MSVTPTSAAAFAPGHVTGLFEIRDEDPDPLHRGSRGAGFSLAHGVITYLEIAPADAMNIEIFVAGTASPAPVTREAITNLLREAVRDGRVPLNKEAPKGSRAKIHVKAWCEVQLPVSQGFGMSAAGALSATLALARCLRMGRSEALRAAHAADVTERGGLGDVVAASVGGFEMRTAPGVPPFGNITGFIGYGDAVLCTIGGPLDTRDVLTDRTRRNAVNAAGRDGLTRLLAAPSLELFLDESQAFTRASGLASPQILRAMEAARPYGKASMSMLGNSVFAFGQVPQLADVLAKFGDVTVVPIAETGARLVDIERPA